MLIFQYNYKTYMPLYIHSSLKDVFFVASPTENLKLCQASLLPEEQTSYYDFSENLKQLINKVKKIQHVQKRFDY